LRVLVHYEKLNDREECPIMSSRQKDVAQAIS
jgi:hypothetical protein